jgi:transcriptional regulator with XRE-family HTH domain
MESINAAARYRELGDELRRRRATTGVSATEVARRTGWSKAKVSRIESGAHEIGPVDMVHYLGACGIYRGQALDLLAKCRAAAECGHGYWLRPHEPGLPDTTASLMYHEGTANALTWYEPLVIPGLLQTESYIRALSAERWPLQDIDFAVRVRLARQRILHWPDPGQFTFLINETALRLQVGDPAVMQEQMLAMTLLDALSHVVIRVVPEETLFGGAFLLFEYVRHQPLVFIDAYAGGFFLEDKEYVDVYRELIPVVADAALNEAQSREFIAALAYEYDRGSARNDVEEEQLQR